MPLLNNKLSYKMLKLKLDTAYSPAMWRLFEGIGCDTMEDLAHAVGDIRGDIDVAFGLEAALAGGAVHIILGNHEIMNAELDFRFVTESG